MLHWSSLQTTWFFVSGSHLDDVSMSPVDNQTKSVDGKPPLTFQTTQQQTTSGAADVMKDSSGRVVGRRKLAPGSSPSLRRKTFQSSNR